MITTGLPVDVEGLYREWLGYSTLGEDAEWSYSGVLHGIALWRGALRGAITLELP